MTESQENLEIAKANEKFWKYMRDDKNKILQEELEKVEQAKEKFKKMFSRLQAAPEKLSQASQNVKALETRIEKERATIQQEVSTRYEEMKQILTDLGIIS